jgi:hypothetical protein
VKIRTATELSDYLDSDLSWRKRELITIENLIRHPSKNETLERFYLRSGIVLLYAHWEGAVKTSSKAYLNFVAYSRTSLPDMTDNFIAVALRTQILQAGLAKKPSIHNALVNFFTSGMRSPVQIPYDTIFENQGNLNSDLFQEITLLLGIPYHTIYNTRRNLIDEVLLYNRNLVAHGDGQMLMSVDVVRFLEIRKLIVEMLEMFNTDVLNYALMQKYRRI